jgi:hypothetical protein
MRHRPPKGKAPPWLEGKRTGRPKGSRSHQQDWDNMIWGYDNRLKSDAHPPNKSAWIWWHFAHYFPNQVEDFLVRYGKI